MNRRIGLLFLLLASVGLAQPEYPKQGADIYDTKADGSDLISAAIVKAKAEHKRILLDFGANWCPWCHKLHNTFESDGSVASELSKDYVVVMIDVNARRTDGVKRNADLNLKYGNPVHYGLPVLMVLDSDGVALTTQDSGELEEGNGHSPAKIDSFLTRWAPTPR